MPVLGTPSLLGQSLLHGQLIPTTGEYNHSGLNIFSLTFSKHNIIFTYCFYFYFQGPVRINAARPGGGRPGWEQ